MLDTKLLRGRKYTNYRIMLIMLSGQLLKIKISNNSLRNFALVQKLTLILTHYAKFIYYIVVHRLGHPTKIRHY